MTRATAANGRFVRPRQAPRLGAVLLLASAAGCVNEPEQQRLARLLKQTRAENTALREEARRLQQDLQAREEHIARLQGLGEKRLEKLFHVAGITLGRTSGVDLDGKPGDDAVRVYLRPVDRDGHAIKAAGSVTVQLFDLEAQPADSLLATYEYPLEAAAGKWSSGFLTYHYRFDCRWKAAPPKRPELTVRVSFIDYLTGRKFAAQKVIDVKLPAATRPAK